MTAACVILALFAPALLASSIGFYRANCRTHAELRRVSQEYNALALVLAKKTIKPQPCQANCTEYPFRLSLARRE